jgi:hypothetical protein
MTPVANARMYAVMLIKAHWPVWAELARAGSTVKAQTTHGTAGAVGAQRPGPAMMCGMPFAMRTPRPTLVAAPIRRRHGTAPAVYFTDVACRDAGQTLADTFGVAGTHCRSLSAGGLATICGFTAAS